MRAVDLDELLIPDHIVMVNTAEIVEILKGQLIGAEYIRATNGCDPVHYNYLLGLTVGMIATAMSLGVYDNDTGQHIIDTIMEIGEEGEEDAENRTE